jgi:hypothetical protein
MMQTSSIFVFRKKTRKSVKMREIQKNDKMTHSKIHLLADFLSVTTDK